MEQIDQVQAQRVWQRVRGAGGAEEPDLPSLIAAEWEDAATYLQLARRFSGREAAILRQMSQQEQSHCACLRGLRSISTGSREPLPHMPPISGSPEKILRECYGREPRAMRAYDARSADPQYGHVFARLRDQEQEHCRMILELMGKLKNP